MRQVWSMFHVKQLSDIIISRSEYENWFTRRNEYYKFLGQNPFGATFESQQIRQIKEYDKAIETLDVNYLLSKLEDATVNHIWGIGYDLAFEGVKKTEGGVTTFTDIKPPVKGQLGLEIDKFLSNLPPKQRQFLDDADVFVIKHARR